MNILGCLDTPTSGRYLIDGVDVERMDEDDLADLRNRKIGFVFQSFNLVARTSALVNVELPLAYAGLRGSERRRRAERALRSVGMGHRMDHQPAELSGGQQQRVAIARAIVTNPALILADEPTGNLDSRSTEEVLRIFARLNEDGRTLVLITHEPDVAAQAKRVIQLSDGEVVRRSARAGGARSPSLPAQSKAASRSTECRRGGGSSMIGPETLRIAWSGITANKLRSGLDDPRHDDRGRLRDRLDRRRQRLLPRGLLPDPGAGDERAAGDVRRRSRRPGRVRYEQRRAHQAGRRSAPATGQRAGRAQRLAGRQRPRSDARQRLDQLRTVVVRRHHPLLPDSARLRASAGQLVHLSRRRPSQARGGDRSDGRTGTVRRSERRRSEHQGQREQLRNRRRARPEGDQRRRQRGRRGDGADIDRAGLAHRIWVDRLDHRRGDLASRRSTPPKPR